MSSSDFAVKFDGLQERFGNISLEMIDVDPETVPPLISRKVD